MAVLFSPSHENPSQLDRRSSRRSYTTVWSTSDSKFSVSYFPISQLPTTQLHHHSTSPYSRLAHCSSLHCTPRAASSPPPARPTHCFSHNLCEPLHASRRTALMDLYRIIFLFSDLITKEALISYCTMTIVGSSKWRRPPTIGMH